MYMIWNRYGLVYGAVSTAEFIYCHVGYGDDYWERNDRKI
jgi:hypothetical protein